MVRAQHRCSNECVVHHNIQAITISSYTTCTAIARYDCVLHHETYKARLIALRWTVLSIIIHFLKYVWYSLSACAKTMNHCKWGMKRVHKSVNQVANTICHLKEKKGSSRRLCCQHLDYTPFCRCYSPRVQTTAYTKTTPFYDRHHRFKCDNLTRPPIFWTNGQRRRFYR